MVQGKTLHLETNTPTQAAVAVLKALASTQRWRILQYLADGSRTINEIAEALDLPTSTVAANIKILESAGLIETELRAAAHGLQKVCARTCDTVFVQLPAQATAPSNIVEVAMPIGAYTNFDVLPTCGLTSPTSLIGYVDDPLCFYEPDRINAGLLWFHSGYVEYVFPNRLPAGTRLLNLQLSMEICSESPFYKADHPSDITVWINGCEIGTWTSPSDFGGRRGALTPDWWGTNETQYGLLKRWIVTSDGAQIDGYTLSTITLHDLQVEKRRVITVRLGVKPDALHVGGVNLFGRSFGNYPQDLILRMEYAPGRRSETDN